LLQLPQNIDDFPPAADPPDLKTLYPVEKILLYLCFVYAILNTRTPSTVRAEKESGNGNYV